MIIPIIINITNMIPTTIPNIALLLNPESSSVGGVGEGVGEGSGV